MAETVKMGGKDFTLRPLTFDELQECIEDMGGATPYTKEGMTKLRSLMNYIFRDQAKPEEIGALSTSMDELFEVQERIAEVSGLRPLNDRLMKRAKEQAENSRGNNSTQI